MDLGLTEGRLTGGCRGVEPLAGEGTGVSPGILKIKYTSEKAVFEDSL